MSYGLCKGYVRAFILRAGMKPFSDLSFMPLKMQQKRRKHHGTAALEFAIAAPIFFLFVFAIFEFGRAFMVIDLLGNAARAGCREGVVQGKSTSGITTDVLSQLQSESVNGASVTVEVNGVVADSSTAKSGDVITVVVTVPVSSVTWTSTNFLSGSLSGQSGLAKQ
jgi:Flp pilus assembly protein TadG